MENGEVSLSEEALFFGEVLKKARERKNLTIDDIVTETRISKQVIEQIESKTPDYLPEPVFLRGFIKSYAEQVDLDPVQIVEMYKTKYGIVDQPISEVVENPGSVRNIRRKTSKAPYIIGLLVILAIIVLFTVTRDKAEIKDDTQAKTGVETGQATAADPQAKVVAEGVKLEIVCVEETTLKISKDNNKVTEYKMKPEDHLELKAKKEFNILIDNTCGVTLFMNNKPVDIPGKCGQTVNVQLP